MAKLLVTLRLTGRVSNGEARAVLALLSNLADVCEVVGVEVKQSLDVRLDPEPVPVVVEPEPEAEFPVHDRIASDVEPDADE